MKTGLKWFLRIVLGVLIVAVLATAGYLVINRWHNTGWMMSDRNPRILDNDRARAWQSMPGRIMPWNNLPNRIRPVRPAWGFPDGRSGMFGPLRLLFLCAICAGFILLVVLAVVYLIRGPRRAQQPAGTPAPIAPVAAPPLDTAQPAPSPALASTHPCPHCAQPVQDDWKHCPYCGSPLS